jgi:WD40 repeat protein
MLPDYVFKLLDHEDTSSSHVNFAIILYCTKSNELCLDVLFLTIIFSILYYFLYIIYLSFRDKIATGSFDKTCKLWSAETGKCFHTYRGHTAEIVRYRNKIIQSS